MMHNMVLVSLHIASNVILQRHSLESNSSGHTILVQPNAQPLKEHQ